MSRALARVRVVDGLLLAAAVLFGFRAALAARNAQGEIAAYWTAGRLLLERAPVARFYEDEAFRGELRAHGIAQNDIWYPNPPTTAVLFVPLSGLPFRLARAVWTGASAAFLAAAVVFLARAARLKGGFLLAFVLFGLLGQPSFADLRHGQIYAFVTLLAAVAAWAFREGRTGAFGSLLGALAAVKLAGSHLWLLGSPKGLRKALLWAFASAGALVLLSIPAVGLDGWKAFLSVPGRIARDPSFSTTAFQSLGGLVRRLCVPDARWNPRPLFDAPLAASVLFVGVPLALAAVVLLLAFRGRDRGLAFSAAILAGLLSSPFSQDYTYTQAVVPAAFLLSSLEARRDPAGTLAALVGIVLIGASAWHREPAFQDGAAALLAYPKVYGALILLALAVRLSSARPPQGRGAAPARGLEVPARGGG